jgi:hypothetical protein
MRDEWHHREVRDCGVDRVAGAQRNEAAARHPDLLFDLPLRRLPCRFALVDTPAWQCHLPGVVTQVAPAPHKWDLPAPAGLGLVQDEHDRRLPGAPAEFAPAVDRLEQVFEAAEEIDLGVWGHKTSDLMIGSSSQ